MTTTKIILFLKFLKINLVTPPGLYKGQPVLEVAVTIKRNSVGVIFVVADMSVNLAFLASR